MPTETPPPLETGHDEKSVGLILEAINDITDLDTLQTIYEALQNKLNKEKPNYQRRTNFTALGTINGSLGFGSGRIEDPYEIHFDTTIEEGIEDLIDLSKKFPEEKIFFRHNRKGGFFLNGKLTLDDETSSHLREVFQKLQENKEMLPLKIEDAQKEKNKPKRKFSLKNWLNGE